MTQLFQWFLQWTSGGQVEKGTPMTGTQEEFDNWWNNLHESTKQMCDLIINEL